MNDDGASEMWSEYRRAQQVRRAARLPKRSEEIASLSRSGFSVKPVTAWQFRVDDRLDLYPIHRRWHDVKTGKRGSYKTAREVAFRILREKQL